MVFEKAIDRQVLQPQHFSEASDIDLAVAGLEFPQFMQLFAEAKELTRFSLDLLRWEEVDPSFQRVIVAKGVVLYGYENG
jgi:predicted nucleotidyltransferase